MSSGCGDVLSLQDLQVAKANQLFEAEVITGKQGGVATGADIDFAINQNTGQSQKTLPATLRDAGFFPASFDFTSGGTLTANDRNKVVYDPVSQAWYSWAGALPKVIPAATNPLLDANWKPQTDPKLRADLANSTDAAKGDALVAVKQPFTGAVAMTQHDFNKAYVNVLQFGADPTGVAESAPAIQAAIDAVYARGGGEVFLPATTGNGTGNNAGFRISSTIVVKPFVNLRGEGFASLLKASTALPNGVLQIQAGGGISGRYMQDFRVGGNGSGLGMGTDLLSTDTSTRQCYGWHFGNLTFESFSTSIQMQGLWHSTFENVTTSSSTLGLHFYGQCVSIHIVGCHFRRDNIASANSIGIRIQPRVYAWSPNQTRGSRSEAIIIDGETMCIGVEHGIYIDDGLDIRLSNLDLDYCLKSGVTVVNADGTFTFKDSWVAGDGAGTAQFFGVNIGTPLDPSTKKVISGIHFNAKNASVANTGIGINIASGNNFVSVENNTFNTGDYSVYAAGSSDCTVRGNLMGMQMYMDGCSNFKIKDNRLAGLQEANKPANTIHLYSGNSGTPATDGIVNVPLAGGSGTGTLVIPNGQSSLNYYLTKLDRNVSAAQDILSITATTITVNRPSPVGVALSSLVQFTAV